MNRHAALLLLLLACVPSATAADTPGAHSRYQRPVNAAGAAQNYFVLDADVLAHSRADLGDLRLYTSAGKEQPYALRTEAGAQSPEQAPAQQLNKGTTAGRLTFLLDTSIEQYDQVTFQISAKDFVVQAQLDGADSNTGPWTSLGSYPLYDFSREQLGKNFSVRLKSPAAFHFLRVTIPGLKPDDVTGASIAFVPRRKPQYIRLPYAPSFDQKDKDTVIRWSQPEEVPVERITFDLPASQVNFRRPVELYCEKEKHKELMASGDLSRIHLTRNGKVIQSEDLSLLNPGLHCAHYLIEIHNGDDPPLQITALYPEMLERRLYFASPDAGQYQLYYGDKKLSPPVYDYAKLFSPEPDKALQASLGPELQNPAYQPRPDDRPWSERHPAVLWIVMILAVAGLAVVALRGFRI